ncbi:MAG: single-stranded DNA-binding protein, partial [Myxococcota bacterium]
MPTSSTLVDTLAAYRFAFDGIEYTTPKLGTVYNPMEYAWAPTARYLERFGEATPRRVLFLGMNPGPWGMAQTGVPFGDVVAVRDWMGIREPVEQPSNEIEARPI